MIVNLAICKVLFIVLFSVAEQIGLSSTWRETLKVAFSHQGSFVAMRLLKLIELRLTHAVSMTFILLRMISKESL